MGTTFGIDKTDLANRNLLENRHDLGVVETNQSLREGKIPKMARRQEETKVTV